MNERQKFEKPEQATNAGPMTHRMMKRRRQAALAGHWWLGQGKQENKKEEGKMQKSDR